MTDAAFVLTLAGMLVVTYLPRVLPAMLLQGRALHPFLTAWLKYVPVAVLAALLLPSLLVVEDRLNVAWDNLYLWAAIPAGLVALKTRSLFFTVLVGMGVVIIGRLILS
jgi:branched-subunit amino acid transport protein